MTSAGEAIVNEILRDLRAHGFTKLRVTTHGTIYGLDRFRISLPNNMPDKGHNSLQERLRKRWLEVKSEAYGALPGLKARVLERNGHGMSPSEVSDMQPMTPLEVVLPPDDDREEVAHSDEAPETVTKVWQCPKCHTKLKSPGRHLEFCGKERTVKPLKSRSKHYKPAVRTEDVKELLARLNEAVEQMATERDQSLQQLRAVRQSLGN